MHRAIAAAALLLGLSGVPAWAQRAAFAVEDVAIRGRALEAFAVSDAAGSAWLVALSAEAMPPNERRWVTLLPRGDVARAVAIPVPAQVAALDVADLGGAPGPELLLLGSERLRILDARGALVRDGVAARPPGPPRKANSA